MTGRPKGAGLKTRARWAIGGGVAAIIIALYVGLSGGMGSGSGTPSPNISNENEPPREVPSKYYVIEVTGSRILVDGREVKADEAADGAKKDGRPVEVRWNKAYTDAEAALKKALRAAGVKIARETRL